jgi:hypothetical protein
MTQAADEMMTTAEVCRRLFTSGRTVQKWMRDDKLTVVRVDRAAYVTRESVVRMGAELGMTEGQVMRGAGEADAGATRRPGPPRYKPTAWESVTNRACPRCGRATARGWCITC